MTNPITRLVFDWSSITGVQDGGMLEGSRQRWPQLARVGKGFIETPKHETWSHWVL